MSNLTIGNKQPSSSNLPSQGQSNQNNMTTTQSKLINSSSSAANVKASLENTTDKYRNENLIIDQQEETTHSNGGFMRVFQELKDKATNMLFQHQYWNLFSSAASNSVPVEASNKFDYLGDNNHQIRPPFIIERFDRPIMSGGKKGVQRKTVPLLQLENYLNKCLVNQEIAIKTVCFCLLRQSTIWSYSYHQLTNENQFISNMEDNHQIRKQTKIPLSLFLIGPVGCGKIYLSKLIAQSQSRPFVLLDMSYFTEEEDLSNLVQFSDEYRYSEPFNYMLGQLNVILETTPNAVIVFNNMESAHPSVFRFLHQLFRSGIILEQKTRKQSSSLEPGKKEKKKDNEDDLVKIIDASQAIFICISVISDQVVKKNILESGPNNLIEKYEKEKKTIGNWDNGFEGYENEDAYDYDFKRRMNRTKVAPPPPSSKFVDQVTSSYSTIDALDRVIEFRHQITPILVDHLNNSNKSTEESKQPKCFDAFLHQFNAIIPFFAFSDIELCNQIVTQLNVFSTFAFTQKRFKMTWSEDVVIWLMKRYRPSLTVTGVLENHILTPLAASDHLFAENDHIHLEVSPELDRVSVVVLNRRDDIQLRRSLNVIQSKL
ncbi:predicted protein [Naegleria gruberi]|uniref:Predicted protein n=1 Tax=Naegleria gruberi TaxID=5762 RepID=D2UYT2_NAEGR|nr:uncharacterized protein NAEGRDRAFT_45254 [Naegleria gruberi]EFC50841.1 predicted protein [Naegleria gruberi]|eukprot:XP_002683585.1 predicted protein [Naegleria gruberi strain NEG-M]